MSYLDFAAAHPRLYEAMFSLPSELAFAVDDTPEPLRRAFSGIREAFPDADGTRAEVAWSMWHGLATLQAAGRLRPGAAQARLDLANACSPSRRPADAPPPDPSRGAGRDALVTPASSPTGYNNPYGNKENPVTATREVFDRHMSHQLDRDLDAILTDYAPDAVVVGPAGIGSGHDHIRASYEQVLPLIGGLDVTAVQVQGEVVYVNFRARVDGSDDLVGTDTFVIRDGLIHVHTFYAATESPVAGDRP